MSHDPVGQNVQSLAELHREFNKSLNSSGWLGFSPTPDELESLIKAAPDRFPKFAQMEERAAAKQEGRPPDRAVGSIILPSGATIPPEDWPEYARKMGRDPDEYRKELLRKKQIKVVGSEGG